MYKDKKYKQISGIGVDIHKFSSKENTKYIKLGGVKVDHNRSLLGHSDADVIIHSLVDSILGTISEGDIGSIFSDKDPKWKNADSLILLGHVMELIEKKGWQIQNIDSVIVAERPKLKPYIDLMKEKISKKIGIDIDDVGVKATTNEKLGAEGREEGICCHAVVLMKKNENN